MPRGGAPSLYTCAALGVQPTENSALGRRVGRRSARVWSMSRLTSVVVDGDAAEDASGDGLGDGGKRRQLGRGALHGGGRRQLTVEPRPSPTTKTLSSFTRQCLGSATVCASLGATAFTAARELRSQLNTRSPNPDMSRVPPR